MIIIISSNSGSIILVIDTVQDRDRWWALVSAVMNLRVA
jgi:hypothetical protein